MVESIFLPVEQTFIEEGSFLKPQNPAWAAEELLTVKVFIFKENLFLY
jgi:hypothetical protein